MDRVDDLQKNWPPEWGEVEGNIGVVAPYSDQVTLRWENNIDAHASTYKCNVIEEIVLVKIKALIESDGTCEI